MNGQQFLSQVLHEPPFTQMHPKVGAFLKEYLADEKVVEFGGRYVLSTHFPPYPSPAFDNMAAQFNAIGETSTRSLYSVTLAVTNRCNYACWHCYNAGRNQKDVPVEILEDTVWQLQSMNVVVVTITGGEPLLRTDLEQIVAAFDDSTYLTLNTTGSGLTTSRARALKANGLYALGVSLDSPDPAEHDRMRGTEGAFATAVQALSIAADAGLYPYVIAVGTHEMLKPGRFESFMQFTADCGALEVHLLEPSATGKLAGKTDVLLDQEERIRVLDLQREIAAREDLPILSSFLYVESPEAFGCGAGLTHLYIDGSGEVCPCNLVPLSFGNITQEPLTQILDRMGEHFCKPRNTCVGRDLAPYICGAPPLSPKVSAKICDKHLPKEHDVPRFFQVRREAQGDVGAEDLKVAYNKIHDSYDAFWLTEAAQPIQDLLDKLHLRGNERVFEAGCGTGYATVLIGKKLDSGKIHAADISEGMITNACARARSSGVVNVQFTTGDALAILDQTGQFDLVFSSWVLGYIPVLPFLAHARHALKPGGRVAFVVHKENSPREPLDIFWDIVAEDPSVLEKRVVFDFPRDMPHVMTELEDAGFQAAHIWDGFITFHYNSPEEVFEHLLKSGAGTAFYDAVDPQRRKALEQRFLDTLRSRHEAEGQYNVVHDYISCIATKK